MWPAEEELTCAGGGVRKAEQDLERELRSEEEARYAARRAFGNTTFVKEDVREMWGWAWFERFCHGPSACALDALQLASLHRRRSAFAQSA